MKKRVSMLAVLLTVPLLCTTSYSAEPPKACYISQEYVDIAHDLEDEYGISASLICSIIQHESSGRPDVSNGQCKGLMGVSEVNNIEHFDLYNPQENMRLGTEVLLHYMESSDGEVYLALQRYHGESQATSKFERFCQTLDYRELSKYARSVEQTANEIQREWEAEDENN